MIERTPEPRPNCTERVSTSIPGRSRQCRRAAVADGKCAQHHPDVIAKRREARRFRYQLEADIVQLGFEINAANATFVQLYDKLQLVMSSSYDVVGSQHVTNHWEDLKRQRLHITNLTERRKHLQETLDGIRNG